MELSWMMVRHDSSSSSSKMVDEEDPALSEVVLTIVIDYSGLNQADIIIIIILFVTYSVTISSSSKNTS